MTTAVRRIQVKWGGEWIYPKRAELKTDRDVVAFVKGRDGWASVRFHNYRGREIAWRYAP